MADGTGGHDFVKIVEGWGETQFGPNSYWIDTKSKFAFEKIAKAVGSAYVPPDLVEKIAEIQGRLPANKVAFYNRALGCFESYGINKNGDGWRRSELIRKHATFVEKGNYFDHHRNHDPALGWGRPVASAWNPRTDMVDLIIVADLNKQAEQDIQLLERGLSVPTSMGCRVKYDVCLLCDHKARHRGEYCDHVKEAATYPYGMGMILPDGRICGVDNPDPEFFDISRVTNPAFLGSENLLKVAQSITGAYSARVAKAKAVVGEASHRAKTEAKVPSVSSAKMAEELGFMPKSTTNDEMNDKAADIVKRLQGKIDGAIFPSVRTIHETAVAAPEVVACMPKISEAVLRDIVKAAGVDGLIRETAALGIILSPEEFRFSMEVACGKKIASFPAPKVEDILSAKPVDVSVYHGDSVNKLAALLAPFHETRSVHAPAIMNTIFRAGGGTVKHASDVAGTSGEVARRLYSSYRSGLINNLIVAGGRDGDINVMKLAETSKKLVTKTSAAFSLLAFCSTDMAKDAQEFFRGSSQDLAIDKVGSDNGSTNPKRISGQMADEFGEEVLDGMAGNSMRRFLRRCT
jgi:hypothetical protein